MEVDYDYIVGYRYTPDNNQVVHVIMTDLRNQMLDKLNAEGKNPFHYKFLISHHSYLGETPEDKFDISLTATRRVEPV